VVFTARAAAAGGAWDITGFWQQHVLGGGGERWTAAWAKIIQHDDLRLSTFKCWACWRLVGGVLCAMPAPIGWQGCTAFNGHADLRGGVFVRRVRLRQALGPWVLHSPWSACPSEDAG